jgi:hypothetical protein
MKDSPLGNAIDRACGFDRAAFEKQKSEADAAAAKALLDAADTLISWWKSKRPRGWSKKKHLSDPRAYCTTQMECLMADRAAALVKAGF